MEMQVLPTIRRRREQKKIQRSSASTSFQQFKIQIIHLNANTIDFFAIRFEERKFLLAAMSLRSDEMRHEKSRFDSLLDNNKFSIEKTNQLFFDSLQSPR
jgi:hypothetical protein